MLETLSPASVRIVEGTVRYVDERSGQRHDVTALDVDLVLDDSSGPLQSKGSLVWRGEKLALESSLSPLRALIEDRSAKLSLKVSGQPIETSYDGTVDVAAGLTLAGNISLKSPSVQALGTWAGGKPLAAGRDAGALALSSSLTGASGRVSLAGLTGTLGDTAFNGDLAVESKAATALCQRHPQAFAARHWRHADPPQGGRDGPEIAGPRRPRRLPGSRRCAASPSARAAGRLERRHHRSGAARRWPTRIWHCPPTGSSTRT